MRRSRSSLLSAVVILGLAPVLIVGCGSDGYGGSAASTAAPTTAASTPTGATAGGTATTLTLAADASGALTFDPPALSATAGTVTIVMTNPSGSGMPHAIAIEGNGVDEMGDTAQPGGTSTVTATLTPGTYTYYCPVKGHKAGGMTGTLTVT